MRLSSDEVKEGDEGSEKILDLGFGSCRLQVQVPEKGPYATSKDLVGCRIATSFVSLATEYFAKLEAEAGSAPNGNTKLKTKIVSLNGSVEAACAVGVADGIVDLVGPSPSSLFSSLSMLTPSQNPATLCAPLVSRPSTQWSPPQPC